MNPATPVQLNPHPRAATQWRALAPFALSLLPLFLSACAPSARLTFPPAPLESAAQRLAYDTNGDGSADFFLTSPAPNQPLRTLAYDDDGDGAPDRLYNMDDYDDRFTPHVIILVDSIPFGSIARRYAAGGFPHFDPPQKVIAPFPTMSGLIFSRIMHAPPLPGVNNQYYDPRAGDGGSVQDMISGRAFGHVNPWQRTLDYHAGYIENGLAFLRPRPWYAAELERIRRAVDKDHDLTTIAYLASASGLLSVHGEAGAEEALDGLERLCLQLLYERQGCIDITILSDHGHNFVPGRHFDIEQALDEAGFDVGGRIRDNDDVVVDLDGLVNYAGVHTRTPQRLAEALVTLEPVEMVMYLDEDAVVIRSASGVCKVRAAAGAQRFAVDFGVAIPSDQGAPSDNTAATTDGDPLHYGAIAEDLLAEGIMDRNGFAPDLAWFQATIDHEYPDALRRAWDAFHGAVVNPPAVMVVIRDGWYVGDKSFETYITMKSTHGGFNQQHSAAFVLTTTGRVRRPMRSHEVLPAVLPRTDEEPAR